MIRAESSKQVQCGRTLPYLLLFLGMLSFVASTLVSTVPLGVSIVGFLVFPSRPHLVVPNPLKDPTSDMAIIYRAERFCLG